MTVNRNNCPISITCSFKKGHTSLLGQSVHYKENHSKIFNIQVFEEGFMYSSLNNAFRADKGSMGYCKTLWETYVELRPFLQNLDSIEFYSPVKKVLMEYLMECADAIHGDDKYHKAVEVGNLKKDIVPFEFD